eukprot:15364541-Ditylum_brightwellii.AAC.1
MSSGWNFVDEGGNSKLIFPWGKPILMSKPSKGNMNSGGKAHSTEDMKVMIQQVVGTKKEKSGLMNSSFTQKCVGNRTI